MEKKITVIPATEKHYVKTADGTDHRKKVAGYARVSTDTTGCGSSAETCTSAERRRSMSA